MKNIIPFEQQIEFETNINEIISISLEHKEQIEIDEITGAFIIYGEYKQNPDTTQIIPFKKEIPFTTIYPDNVLRESINIEIENFTYEIIKPNIINIKIDISLTGEETNERLSDYLEEYLEKIEVPIIEKQEQPKEVEELVDEVVDEEETIKIKENNMVIYHIHIVEEKDTLDSIIKKYETTLENIEQYNDIKKLNIGDKLIIPDIYE